MQCEKPLIITHPETKEKIQVPCRKCILCKKRRARDWAIKLIKESLYYNKMCMITLTFSPQFLLRPIWVKLRKYQKKRGNVKNNFEDIKRTIKYKTLINPTYIHDVRLTKWLVQRFIKKLRKWALLQNENKFISYFAAGEHGSNNTHRAHWHIIIFGINKEELASVLKGNSCKGKEIYFSPIIHKLWNFKKLSIGMHTISDVTSATIKYVANYTLKKLYKVNENEQDNNNINNNKFNYPNCFLFSNQNKIGYKWARRSPNEIARGYIEDGEGGKYAIPESYKKELKRFFDSPDLSIDCQELYEALDLCELNIFEKFKDIDKNWLKEQAIIKSKRLKYTINRQNRDFDSI